MKLKLDRLVQPYIEKNHEKFEKFIISTLKKICKENFSFRGIHVS